MIRNIIFDWSGTLVDDLPAVWHATNHVLLQAQREQITLEQFRAEFCLPFKKYYDRVVPHIPLPQLEVWFHGAFREAQDSVVALPHAREFLAFCKERGARTFILSAAHEEHFQAQLAATGFGGFLDRAYVGVLDKREMIHRILEENQLDAAETVFIGDMQHDIETAKHGGVRACAVLTGYNNLQQLRESEPDLIVEHLGELRTALEANKMELKASGLKAEAGRMPIVTVGALILNAAGKVLMVRTHKWSNLWGIPGGKIKWGEESVGALRREIKEETDLEIEDVRFILAQDCIQSPEFYREAHFVLLNYSARCVGEPQVKLNDEAREFVWVTVVEALGMAINRPTKILLEAFRERK